VDYPVSHVLSSEALITPNDADDRDVDIQEDVRRRGENREQAYKQYKLSMEKTTNVYGCRSARRTIHMFLPRDLLLLLSSRSSVSRHS
jgi:hypothetical protein